MSVVEWLPNADLDGMSLVEGIVEDDGGDALAVRRAVGPVVRCDILVDGPDGAPRYRAGDRVLLAVSRDDSARGVVLGRIASPSDRAGRDRPAERRNAPEEDRRGRTVIENRRVVIRATEGLRIECGAGVIEIRENGKIVIRGENLLSRARGGNRIKGGNVGIN